MQVLDNYLADEKELLEFLREVRVDTGNYSDALRRRLDFMIADKEEHIEYLKRKHHK